LKVLIFAFQQRGAVHEKQMLRGGEGAVVRLSSPGGVHRSEAKSLTEQAGGSGAGFSQEGQ